jgi:hypothetical protein
MATAAVMTATGSRAATKRRKLPMLKVAETADEVAKD